MSHTVNRERLNSGYDHLTRITSLGISIYEIKEGPKNNRCYQG